MKACIIFKRFISQEYKRHYFQRGERCPCGHDSRCNTGEIKMMECTRDTADKVNGTGRNRCYGTCTVRYETKCYENKGHQRSREYFKESFYAKVNNPPAVSYTHLDVYERQATTSLASVSSSIHAPRLGITVESYKRLPIVSISLL